MSQVFDKNRLRLFYILLFQLVFLTSCSTNKSISNLEIKNSKADDVYGYIDKSGKFVIKPQYFNASRFSEGLAAVISGDRLSYIKTNGSRAFSKSFEIPLTMCNALGKDGICRVIYYDQVSQGCYFSEGLAPIPFKSGKDYLWGYIDKKGQTVIKPQFKYAESFHENMAAVRFLNDEYGYIDHSGNVLMRFPKAVDGISACKLGPLSLSNCGSFSYGLAPAWVKGKWGYVNKKGDFVIQPQYNSAYPFSDHMSLVKIEHRHPIDVNSPIGKMAKRFSNKLSQSYDVTQECFFIDEKGQRLSNASYGGAGDFSEGLAPVAIERKWGYIDRFGKFIISTQFDYALPFKNGLACVMMKNKYGCIDKNGAWIVQPQFESLGSFFNNLAAAKK